MALAVDNSGGYVTIDPATAPAVTILATRRTVLVRSATSVVDVEEIEAQTVRHGVYFLKYVPYATFLAEGAAQAVNVLGVQIDSALDLPGVDGALFVQDVDATGLIANAIEFIVSIPPPTTAATGPISTSVTITLMALEFSSSWAQAIFDAQAQLLANFG